MKRAFALLALTATLAACPGYDEYPRLSSQDGLVPPDQYARYGAEQAQAVAIARELGAHQGGGSAEAQAAAMDSAVAYARTLPGVVTVTPDTLGYRLTIEFRSGWRTMVVPIADGKRGDETPNLPARGAAR